MDGIQPSTAPGRSRERGSFKVTHPFHPLFGRKFDLLTHRRNWGEDRVYYQEEDVWGRGHSPYTAKQYVELHILEGAGLLSSPPSRESRPAPNERHPPAPA